MHIGKVFTLAAKIEALTWAGLLLGMFVRSQLDYSGGVWLFGRLHGAAFLIYVVVSLITAFRLRWPWWSGLLAILAAVPPLVTWPLEVWYQRRGLLEPRVSTARD